MTGSSPIRILTVDDHPVVRQGIAGLVGVQPDMTVIAPFLRVDKHPLVGLLAGTMAAALAMLVPGRLSVDARLFGWKRIDQPAHKT